MYSLSIPKPCHAGWDNMIPVEKGRYCGACAKTVIDFSILNDAEIQDYFTQHFSAQICGHFKASQLQRIVIQLPGNAIRFDQPFWKRFLVICLLIFGTSIFPFETVIASSQIENSQQTIQSAQPGKNKKKPRTAKGRKMRRRYFSISVPDFKIDIKDFTTLGFTTLQKNECRPGEPVVVPKDSKNKPAYKSEPSPAAEKENDEDGSIPKPPFESVFILPPTLVIKKQLPKTT